MKVEVTSDVFLEAAWILQTMFSKHNTPTKWKVQ